MEVKLRNPNVIMKLSRLGSFHQSKLSFLRSFLKEFRDWEYKRDLFELDEFGHGTAVYSFKKNIIHSKEGTTRDWHFDYINDYKDILIYDTPGIIFNNKLNLTQLNF